MFVKGFGASVILFSTAASLTVAFSAALCTVEASQAKYSQEIKQMTINNRFQNNLFL